MVTRPCENIFVTSRYLNQISCMLERKEVQMMALSSIIPLRIKKSGQTEKKKIAFEWKNVSYYSKCKYFPHHRLNGSKMFHKFSRRRFIFTCRTCFFSVL